MRFSALTACLLSAIVSVPAHAAGGAGEALSYTWTGLYGGVNVGWAYQTSDWDFSGGSTSQNGDDGTVGLQVGYGGQIGDNLYLGIEGSFQTAGMTGESTCLGRPCKNQVNSFSDVSARLGVTNDRTLLYLKGGIAYEDTNYHISNSPDGGDGVGFLIGGGAEYALMYNLTTKLEYNYMRFGDDDHTIDGIKFNAKDTLNVVKLGFNFKFD